MKRVTDYRVPREHVLIKVLRDERMIKFNNGNELYIDPTYEIQDHAPRDGEVVAIPTVATAEWKTEIELLPGDRVWFDYFASVHALGRRIDIIKTFNQVDEKYFWEDDTLYLLIPYRDCFVRKRGDEIHMLNGYSLLEPVKRPSVKSELLEVQDVVDTRIGILRYFGRPNTEYYMSEAVRKVNDKYCDPLEGSLEAGSRVLIRRHSARYLEHELYRRLDGNMYWIVLQRDLEAIIPEGVRVEVKR